MLYNFFKKYKHIIKDFTVRKFRKLQNAHELVIEITLKDNSKLAIKDYLYLDGTRKYAYHWQDKDGSLLIRWDNASHWKNISTFPHHKHVKQVENVEDSNIRDIKQVLAFVSSKLQERQ